MKIMINSISTIVMLAIF